MRTTSGSFLELSGAHVRHSIEAPNCCGCVDDLAMQSSSDRRWMRSVRLVAVYLAQNFVDHQHSCVHVLKQRMCAPDRIMRLSVDG